ncbi:MAG: TIGR00153 family protein [Nitrospirae bacterium RBG_13_43_8]|nr:MAG: TIGR00153 family protein [Nitrospirae bacterium RBG_13_43_8]
MLERVFSGGKTEQRVIDNIKKHIRTLGSASDCFKRAIEGQDKNLMYCVSDLEREGDSIRREIISTIYEGAFLPFLRPNICRFVEIVDEAFDVLEDAAHEFDHMYSKLDPDVQEECVKIADINFKMCELLLLAFETLFTREDLREKTLAIRIYEKKIDEIKIDLIDKMRTREVRGFWEGKILSDFISYLTHVSDVIEDASDYLYIINVSLR